MSLRSKKVSASKLYSSKLVCEGKRFFKNEAEALEAADVGMLERMTVSLGVYQCSACRHWHLTSIKSIK